MKHEWARLITLIKRFIFIMKHKLCIKRQSDDSHNNYYECKSCTINR